MTNKIVILDNSVELYEHYIDDAKWERTLAFPRGGVTYLVSNGTIKFYAYEDYLYRNCLISTYVSKMQTCYISQRVIIYLGLKFQT